MNDPRGAQAFTSMCNAFRIDSGDSAQDADADIADTLRENVSEGVHSVDEDFGIDDEAGVTGEMGADRQAHAHGPSKVGHKVKGGRDIPRFSPVDAMVVGAKERKALKHQGRRAGGGLLGLVPHGLFAARGSDQTPLERQPS